MSLRVVIVIAIAALVTGCTPIRSLKNQTCEELYAKLNAAAKKYTGQIRLLDGVKLVDMKFALRATLLTGREWKAQVRVSFQPSKLRKSSLRIPGAESSMAWG